jgi:hypothetical protein
MPDLIGHLSIRLFAKQAQSDRLLLAPDGLSLAPTPDYGPWRKAIGPTRTVGPIILRLFGGGGGGEAATGARDSYKNLMI